jgi:hypothetical protein
VCVTLCTVFRLIVVLFYVMCLVCVLCLIVVPLTPGENPFAVKINNNNNNNKSDLITVPARTASPVHSFIWSHFTAVETITIIRTVKCLTAVKIC